MTVTPAKELLAYAESAWSGTRPVAATGSAAYKETGPHRVADGVWMWPAFGNVHIFDTSEGLLLFDAGEARAADALYAAIRELTDQPVHTVVYSHGHIDHVCGVELFDAEARVNGTRPPRVVAQQNVAHRFRRYERTAGYNTRVNRRQFGSPEHAFPDHFRAPDLEYADFLSLRLGDLEMQLHHRRGETDDATIGWAPQQKILLTGDFFIWAAPNPGNPQKVQRYAWEWAGALEWMAGLGAEVLLPGHGAPIFGAERIRQALTDTAEYLSHLVDHTVDGMNAGADLETIAGSFAVPEHLREKRYLQPSYDEPEFIVRNVWRLYGGWWDGDPARLKPAPRAELAAEVAALSGGPQALADRAVALLEAGEHRLAAQFAQLAGDSSGEVSRAVDEARLTVFTELVAAATSTMSKGVYRWAAAESLARLDGVDVFTAVATLKARE
ncbi:MBL fold metallo-hydrolase [Brevibacterium sp. 91QC2O2]|uniref:alkyl sulfatase dimerization domain-containing protein n=1 Tax=Brevibacterium TaxID=1696 RepID=UPI00211CD0D2|nr:MULTISPECIES: alkyl sulfatase dimerization domain-containing protein [unclassified Brevibacterium]MCQ9367101.1 MBL fold metallo-hydrolase [Brevibacterium sp. 91QC2O2]MCQ9385452.1 MBL fold metallo-hydrolase [Brevibacterium sp. 68QC2CO]